MSSIPKRNVVGLVCVFIYCVLSRIAVPVAGQCMASTCAFSPSGFEECPGGLDHMLETMNQSIYSALEKLEAAVKRTNEQEQNLFSTFQAVNRSLDEKLQTMNETFSSAIDKLSEKLNAIHDLVNENLQYSRSQGKRMNIVHLVNERVEYIAFHLDQNESAIPQLTVSYSILL